MALSYPSDTTLCLNFPVKVWAYPALALMIFMGVIFGGVAAQEEPFALRPLVLTIGLVFVVVGVLGILNNSSATLTLDAQSRTATLSRRSLRRRTEQTIPFANIRAVRALGDSEFKTVGLILRDGTRLPVEDVQIERREAPALALAVGDWLLSHGVAVDPPDNNAAT